MKLFWSQKVRKVHTSQGEEIYYTIEEKADGRCHLYPELNGYKNWHEDLRSAKKEAQRREWGTALPMDVEYFLKKAQDSRPGYSRQVF